MSMPTVQISETSQRILQDVAPQSGQSDPSPLRITS